MVRVTVKKPQPGSQQQPLPPKPVCSSELSFMVGTVGKLSTFCFITFFSVMMYRIQSLVEIGISGGIFKSGPDFFSVSLKRNKYKYSIFESQRLKVSKQKYSTLFSEFRKKDKKHRRSISIGIPGYSSANKNANIVKGNYF